MLLGPHPLAELFPPMEEATFTALVSDIRENGLREAIILHEGMILDGRNRYRACLEIGVEPMVRQWEGSGSPLNFVVSKNLHRRHLSESQRADIAARITNMKLGDNQHRKEGGPIGPPSDDPPISNADAAKLMNISVRSVKRAKVVIARGSPELQAAVNNGAVSLSAAEAIAYKAPDEQREIISQGRAVIQQAAKEARAERREPKLIIVPTTPPQKVAAGIANLKQGGTIAVPNGSTVETQVRKGMALEAEGQPPEKAAKQIGIGDKTYRAIRDLIIMLDEIDLTRADRDAVAGALSAINDTKQLGSYDAVEPIVRRVWGSNLKNHHSLRTARKRVEHFATVAGIAVQSCSNLLLDEFEIPYLSEDETRRWVGELESARRSLDAFLRKLKDA